MSSLSALICQLAAHEQLQNPDQIVPAAALKMSDSGTIVTPEGESFALTSWSRSQLSTTLGLRWDRWFAGASPEQRSEEVNRRLGRCPPAEKLKLRTTQDVPDDVEAHGTLTALVSPSYTPIPDVAVARLLEAGLRGTAGEPEILRQARTDKTTSYVVAMGEVQHVGGQVGAVWGALHVQNSGVGHSALTIAAHLVRLSCSNGMRAPIPMAEIARRTHRGVQLEALGQQIFTGIRNLPAGLQRSMAVLQTATSIVVDDVESTLRAILKDSGLPVRTHMAGILAAFRQEPIMSAFGVGQAITFYAAHGKDVEPELGGELERAAGNYLMAAAGA